MIMAGTRTSLALVSVGALGLGLDAPGVAQPALRRERLVAGVDGRASTRTRVPVGTEDRGYVRVGADYRFGRWLVDLAGLAGYAVSSARWGVGGGVALLFAR